MSRGFIRAAVLIAASLVAMLFFFDGIRSLVILTNDYPLPGWVGHEATAYGMAALEIAFPVAIIVAAVAYFMDDSNA